MGMIIPIRSRSEEKKRLDMKRVEQYIALYTSYMPSLSAFTQ